VRQIDYPHNDLIVNLELKMYRDKISFFYLNLGHFLDHFFILIFASVAALRLTSEWGMSYSQLIPYATPGFVAFGLCAIPAGWLADKWSRPGMMVIFFIGIGCCAIITSFANTPFQISLSLTLVGVFAAIYHPVGLAMVVEGREKTGILLAVNGIFGNMGVACAALITGILIDNLGWRSAYYLPGLFSIIVGLAYLFFSLKIDYIAKPKQVLVVKNSESNSNQKLTLIRVFVVILFTTALGGLIFQSTTFALPKIVAQRLTDIAGSATSIGFYTFMVFTIAAFAQLVVGYLLDKHSVRTIFAWLAVCQAVLFALMINLTGLYSLIIAIGFMLAVFGAIPITDVLVGRVVQSQWKSRAYALTYLVSFTVSASSIPLIALIQGSYGFDLLFALLCGSAILITIAALALPNEKILSTMAAKS